MSDCIVWTGGVNNRGYGWRYIQGRTLLAHRVAYESAFGPIPEGLTIDHLCRNRLCVNPDHLEAISVRDNILRAPDAVATRNASKTHCHRGHEFTAANTYLTTRNQRQWSCAAVRRRTRTSS